MKPIPAELTIREFTPGDRAAFRRLNEEWILRYFAMGYVADDFICGDRSFYILHRRSARR